MSEVIDPEIQKIAVSLQKYIDHKLDVITDSDWFEQLVEAKVKELSDESEEPVHTCYEIGRDEDGAMDYCLQDDFFDQDDPDPDSKYRFVVTKEKEITDEDDEKLGLRDWLWRIQVYEKGTTNE